MRLRDPGCLDLNLPKGVDELALGEFQLAGVARRCLPLNFTLAPFTALSVQ